MNATLANGSASLFLVSATFAGTGASNFALPGAPPNPLPPNSSGPVPITFSPSQTGQFTATLTINYGNVPQTINLQGNGVLPTFNPNPVAFGTVTVGQAPAKTLTVLITNPSNVTLRFNTDSVQNDPADPAPGAFSETSAPIAGVMLPPGDFTSATLQFNPAIPGTYAGLQDTYTIDFTDPNSPNPNNHVTASVQLTGTGIAQTTAACDPGTILNQFYAGPAFGQIGGAPAAGWHVRQLTSPTGGTLAIGGTTGGPNPIGFGALPIPAGPNPFDVTVNADGTWTINVPQYGAMFVERAASDCSRIDGIQTTPTIFGAPGQLTYTLYKQQTTPPFSTATWNGNWIYTALKFGVQGFPGSFTPPGPIVDVGVASFLNGASSGGSAASDVLGFSDPSTLDFMLSGLEPTLGFVGATVNLNTFPIPPGFNPVTSNSGSWQWITPNLTLAYNPSPTQGVGLGGLFPAATNPGFNPSGKPSAPYFAAAYLSLTPNATLYLAARGLLDPLLNFTGTSVSSSSTNGLQIGPATGNATAPDANGHSTLTLMTPAGTTTHDCYFPLNATTGSDPNALCVPQGQTNPNGPPGTNGGILQAQPQSAPPGGMHTNIEVASFSFGKFVVPPQQLVANPPQQPAAPDLGFMAMNTTPDAGSQTTGTGSGTYYVFDALNGYSARPFTMSYSITDQTTGQIHMTFTGLESNPAAPEDYDGFIVLGGPQNVMLINDAFDPSASRNLLMLSDATKTLVDTVLFE